LNSVDQKKTLECDASNYLKPDGNLDLLKGTYNRVIKEFNNDQPLSFKLTTFVDAPAGSGLGSSSTLVVAILGAFAEWLRLPLVNMIPLVWHIRLSVKTYAFLVANKTNMRRHSVALITWNSTAMTKWLLTTSNKEGDYQRVGTESAAVLHWSKPLLK